MTDWIVHLIEQGGYAGIALLMFIETVFPPVPSEVIMSLAGVSAAKGALSLPLAIAAGTCGAMVGNVAWFVVARALGVDRLRPIVDRFGRILTLDWSELERADHFFDRWERWFVFVGRMMPTIRSLVSVPAGLFGMRWGPFLLWSTLGTAGWTGALATAGYALGRNVDHIDRYLGPASTAVIAALVLWYLYRVFTWKPRGR
jgi:membrane protein DedA with SNARE-associated domain